MGTGVVIPVDGPNGSTTGVAVKVPAQSLQYSRTLPIISYSLHALGFLKATCCVLFGETRDVTALLSNRFKPFASN
jgi:hypothetical protein